MAVLKVLSTDTVEQAFINKYNPTVDEIITAISRAANIITYTKEGGGTLQAILLNTINEKVSGLEVTQGLNNLNFDVTAGTYIVQDEQISYAGGNFTLSNGDATFDRIDVVVLDELGALTIKAGTPAASPLPQVVNPDEYLLGSFWVQAGATGASSGDVFANINEPLETSGPYTHTDELGLPVLDTGGAKVLNDLNDVTLGPLGVFEVLQYDGGKWTNANILINQLGDVTITAPVNGQFLVYNAGTWENTNEIQGVTVSNQLILTGVVSPPVIAVNVDNYNPAGLSSCNVLRLSASGPPTRQISGLQAQPAGTVIKVFNVGTGTIRFLNNDAASLAGNRFLNNGNVDLEPNESLELFYDDIDSKWRITSKNI